MKKYNMKLKVVILIILSDANINDTNINNTEIKDSNNHKKDSNILSGILILGVLGCSLTSGALVVGGCLGYKKYKKT